MTNINTHIKNVDYGVYYTKSGFPLVRTSTNPGLGQYLFNDSTGVYTFSQHDASNEVSFRNGEEHPRAHNRKAMRIIASDRRRVSRKTRRCDD